MDSVIIFGAKYLFVAVVLLWIAAWLQAARHHKTEVAWATIVAGILAGVLDKLGSKMYYDPRPFVTHHIQPLVAHAADNGFPSEHTLLSMTLATILFLYRPKIGILAYVIALLVGISRVAAHVHSPIDIAGATLFGVISGYLGYLTASKLLGSKKVRPVRRDDDRPAGPTKTR